MKRKERKGEKCRLKIVFLGTLTSVTLEGDCIHQQHICIFVNSIVTWSAKQYYRVDWREKAIAKAMQECHIAILEVAFSNRGGPVESSGCSGG